METKTWNMNKDDSSICKSYFSASFDLLIPTNSITYELFVNSSSIADREKFVRLVRLGDSLSDEDISDYRKKYRRLYIQEKHRSEYLDSFISNGAKSPEEKAAVLKTTAINYLEKIFTEDNLHDPIALTAHVSRCRDLVSHMVDIFKNFNVDQLKDLIGKLSFHDFYTYDHSINVSMYSIVLYKEINKEAEKEDIVTAGLGGLLHDLGKVKIPTSILNSTGKLSAENFEIIKTHPSEGFNLLQSQMTGLDQGIDSVSLGRIILEHHENFDGTGYPHKLEKENIHLLSRICSVVDFFDAVTTKRSYQEPLEVKDALTLMSKYSGTKLDPAVFNVFLSQTSQFSPDNVMPIEVTERFDPCSAPTSDCFCSKSSESYGKILLFSDKEKRVVSSDKRISFFKKTK